MNIARSTSKLFLAEVSESVIKALGIFVFARELGPSLIGTFFLFQVSSSFIYTFGDFDIGDAVAKRMSEDEAADEILSTALALKVPLLACYLGAISVFRPQINAYLGADLALLLAVQVVLGHFKGLAKKVLTGKLRVGELAMPSFVESFVFVGVGYLLVSDGHGVSGIVYGFVLSSGVTLVWLTSKISVGLGRPSRKHARSLFDFFKYSFLSSTGNFLFNWTDVLLIGFILSQSAVGIYELSWRVTAPVMLLSVSLSRSMFPQVSALNERDNLERIQNIVGGGLVASLFIVVPAFFGILVFAREILAFGFGHDFVSGWGVLVVIGAVRIIEAVNNICNRSIQATGRPRLSAFAESVALGFNVLLNILLIWQYGIIGAAVATVTTTGIKTAINWVFLRRYVPFTFPRGRIAGILFASVVMSLTLVAVKQIVSIDTLWQLIGLVGFGVIVYTGAALLSRSLRAMMIQNVNRIAL